MSCKVARLGFICGLAFFTACSTTPDTAPAGIKTGKSSGQVRDGGPPVPVDMRAVPAVTPVREPIGVAGNKSPYSVNGVRYRVLNTVKGYRQRGEASWYGTKFHGRKTANGEQYNMYAMSAAHKTLPLPSYARVTNLDNGRSVIVRVNDRGPFVAGRIIDLSYTAAQKLGYIDRGVAPVEVVALDPASLPSVAASAAAPETLPEDASFKLPANTFLQVGAYSSSGQAERVRGRLSASVDYPVFVSQVNRGEKTLYRVRIGPIEQHQTLVALRQSVQVQQLGQPHMVVE